MRIKGVNYKLPDELKDDVNTDLIIPSRFLRVLREELFRHAFEGVIAEFGNKVDGKSILVAGKNMGCGSSREQAVHALLGNGFRVVIAESFGYIFYRNSFNLGLALIQLKDPDFWKCLKSCTVLEVDLESGQVTDETGYVWRSEPVPKHLLSMLEAGGVLKLLANR